MGSRPLSAGEMIERHVEIIGIKSQTGENLLDPNLIDISAAPLELVLHASIPDQGLLPFRGVRHFHFEFFHFPLHADEIRERLEANIP